MDGLESTVVKEIGRICRGFLEIAIESFKCFNELAVVLNKSSNPKSKVYAQQPDGLTKWLKGVNDFCKGVKGHLQEGRNTLLKQMNEIEALQSMNELHKHKVERKSQIIDQLDVMLRSILELKPVPHEDSELSIAKSRSIFILI